MGSSGNNGADEEDDLPNSTVGKKLTSFRSFNAASGKAGLDLDWTKCFDENTTIAGEVR
jgi:hypothetical protein